MEYYPFVIVASNQSEIDFIRANDERFESAPVISGDASPEDVMGRVVAGNLPLSVARFAEEIVVVQSGESGKQLASYRVLFVG